MVESRKPESRRPGTRAAKEGETVVTLISAVHTSVSVGESVGTPRG